MQGQIGDQGKIAKQRTASRQIKHLVALVALLTTTACASILSDDRYHITFDSDPPGATVTVTDENRVTIHRAETPFTLPLSTDGGYFKGKDYVARFELEGFGRVERFLESDLDPWYWGNLLLGGLIGMFLIDPLTGAMWEFEDQRVFAVMEPSTPPAGGTTE